MSNLLRTIENMSANLGPPTDETVLEMKKRLTDFSYPLLTMPPPEVAKLRDFLIREQSRSNVMISRLMLVARQQQIQILNLQSRTVAGRLSRVGRAFSDAWANARDAAGHLFSPPPKWGEGNPHPKGDDKVAMMAAPAERPLVVAP